MDCPGEIELFWIKMFRKLGIKGDIRINFMSGCWFRISCYRSDLEHNENILKELMNRGNTIKISGRGNSGNFEIQFNDYQILPKLFKKMLIMGLEEEKNDRGSWGVSWKDYPSITPMCEKLERVKGFEFVDYEILNDEGIERSLRLLFKKEIKDADESIKENVCFQQVYTK